MWLIARTRPDISACLGILASLTAQRRKVIEGSDVASGRFVELFVEYLVLRTWPRVLWCPPELQPSFKVEVPLLLGTSSTKATEVDDANGKSSKLEVDEESASERQRSARSGEGKDLPDCKAHAMPQTTPSSTMGELDAVNSSGWTSFKLPHVTICVVFLASPPLRLGLVTRATLCRQGSRGGIASWKIYVHPQCLERLDLSPNAPPSTSVLQDPKEHRHPE